MKKSSITMFVFSFFAACAAFLLNATDALAITATNTNGQELLDVIMNVINSPIMSVVGISAIIAGAAMAWMNKIMSAVPIVIGGAAIANADTVANVLGATF